MAQPPTRASHHHHHHHHSHIVDPSRRKKKHPHSHVQQDLEAEDGSGNNFISSSRDASEEDNDDQEETFDDDASVASLRHHQQQASTGSVIAVPVSSSTASIPPNDRDQALIDSASRPHPLSQSHKFKGSPGNPEDRTPSSSSPPKAAPALSHAQVRAAQQQLARGASSDEDYVATRPSVGATLANAASTLSSSSSADLVPKTVAHRQHQDAAGRTTKSAAGLSLGALPATSASLGKPTTEGGATVASTVQGSAVVTPRAAVETTRELSSVHGAEAKAGAVGQGLTSGSSSAKRKGSASNQLTAAALGLRDSSSNTVDSDADGGTTTDGATPYDGDVEYAARTPVSVQISGGATKGPDASATASGVPSQPATTSSASVAFTAPRQVPSRTYIEVVGSRHPDCHPDGDNAKEESFDASHIASADDIRNWVHEAIFNPDPRRDYSINKPPQKLGKDGKERPIRIYADGVYDLFHYAHALQLRQAKLSFPNVHLIVGVVSSYSCSQHKNKPIFSSAERYECVRNCRWVDEVLEDAPWIIDQNLIDAMEIDYVAHDELPYEGKGMEDVYGFVKKQGRFLPTRRTEGVSTSELLGRVAEVYRTGTLDKKLAKVGLSHLAFKQDE